MKKTMVVILASIMLLATALPLLNAEETFPVTVNFTSSAGSGGSGCCGEVSIPPYPVNMEVEDGDRSYFNLTLSGINPLDGYDVTNGEYLGWCAQLDEDIPRGPPGHTVLLYCSLDESIPASFLNENWSKINYVLNNKQGVWQDVRDVIWYYTGFLTLGDLSAAALAMVADADANGVDFCPGVGEIIAILCDGGPDIQRTFFEFEVPDDPDGTPVIKAKFEVSQGIMGYEHDPFYIDDDLTVAGTQVDPPMIHNGTTWVGYYAFVFDPNGNQELEVVHADVWHPSRNFPDNPLGEDDWFKYDLWLYPLDDFTIDTIFLPYLYAVHDAEQGGLNPIICYGDRPEGGYYDWDDLIAQLLNGQIKVYYTHKELHYCQPAGYYRVDLFAYDTHGAFDVLTNYFEYVIGVGIETDFSGLDFGDAKLSVWKWIYGDWEFDSGGPTIRSIGNWDNKVLLEFDDLGMSFGDEGGEDRWNVVFDVRLAETFGPQRNRSFVEKSTDLFGGEEYYNSIWPFQQVVLPCDWDPRGLYPTGPNDIIEDDYFAKCNTSKISFGIHIRKPITYDLYTGFLTIEVEPPHTYSFLPGLPCGL